MSDSLQKALDLAAKRAREAETFYKDWAQRADNAAVRLLFGELGAAEHGYEQILAHITSSDVAGRSPRDVDGGVTVEPPARVKAPARASLPEAIRTALAWEEAAGAVFEQLAGLEGEASALFRALVSERRSHVVKLRALLDALPQKP